MRYARLYLNFAGVPDSNSRVGHSAATDSSFVPTLASEVWLKPPCFSVRGVTDILRCCGPQAFGGVLEYGGWLPGPRFSDILRRESAEQETV